MADTYDSREEDVRRLSFWVNVLVMVSGVLAMVPGIGFLVWIIGAPVCVVLVILGVVMLSKGAVGRGVGVLMVGLFFMPAWLAVVPVVSTSIAGSIMRARVDLVVTEEHDRQAVMDWMRDELKAEHAQVAHLGDRQGNVREVTLEGDGALGGRVKQVYRFEFAEKMVISAELLRSEKLQ